MTVKGYSLGDWNGAFVVKNCIYFTTNGPVSVIPKKRGKAGRQGGTGNGERGRGRRAYSAVCAFLSRLT
jgi:hypothetical protein